MGTILSPKGVELVEDLLADMENFQRRIGDVTPGGKADRIKFMVASCASQIMDEVEE